MMSTVSQTRRVLLATPVLAALVVTLVVAWTGSAQAAPGNGPVRGAGAPWRCRIRARWGEALGQ